MPCKDTACPYTYIHDLFTELDLKIMFYTIISIIVNIILFEWDDILFTYLK